MPRTLSGKVLEVPVKRILTGTPADQAASRDSLANPRSLDYFTELAGEAGAARRPETLLRLGRRASDLGPRPPFAVPALEPADERSTTSG